MTLASRAHQQWDQPCPGMPRNKIVLGMASFRVTDANAYLGTSGSLALYAPFVAKDQPAGDA